MLAFREDGGLGFRVGEDGGGGERREAKRDTETQYTPYHATHTCAE